MKFEFDAGVSVQRANRDKKALKMNDDEVNEVESIQEYKV